MKTPTEKENLLADILSEETSPDFRAASLERTLAVVRQRRSRQRAIRMAGAACIVCAFLALSFWKSPRTPEQKNIASVQPSVPTVPGTNIRIINDDELLSMFPDRPVALIGPPEDRQFVFLDELRKQTRHEQKL